ncbi:hypothetical protein EUTSA_v10015970mg [Eutrema salsugineum]|uniref:HMA domain-containing protein n=1 Tax=Eutrema salsugineum TaxID=72664 RepID=V4NBF4_EUTSA|nr:hypothetical protein EUTSA_v10015970mg [Eutrema salsugineum]
MQEKVVFTLGTSDRKIRQKAMKLVCGVPGVTAIDVKEHGKLKVTGEFDKYPMTKKLRKIYEHADIIAIASDEGPGQNHSTPVPRVTWPKSYPRRNKGPMKKSDVCIIM